MIPPTISQRFAAAVEARETHDFGLGGVAMKTYAVEYSRLPTFIEFVPGRFSFEDNLYRAVRLTSAGQAALRGAT
jgi:hypothetical protein